MLFIWLLLYPLLITLMHKFPKESSEFPMLITAIMSTIYNV